MVYIALIDFRVYSKNLTATEMPQPPSQPFSGCKYYHLNSEHQKSTWIKRIASIRIPAWQKYIGKRGSYKKDVENEARKVQ